MPSRFRAMALWICGASVLFAPWAFGQGSPAYVPGEVLIKFKPGLPAAQRIGLESELNARTLDDFAFIGVVHLKLEAGTTVEQAIARYRFDPRVSYVEPNYVVHALLTPNDPNFSL